MSGFILGWTYAFEMIIVCIADVTAFGIYMGFWFPEVARWIWVLFLVASYLLWCKPRAAKGEVPLAQDPSQLHR